MTVELKMTPGPGENRVCYLGDTLTFGLEFEGDLPEQFQGGQAFLRTTLGSGALLNDEIVRSFEESVPLSDTAWHDVPMLADEGGFRLSVILGETGYFRAKAYLTDREGRQYWPAGDDFGVSVHPNDYRTANILYCAWPRLFGEDQGRKRRSPEEKAALKLLAEKDYATIPPSGTLRELTGALDHIIDRLGCRIIHLLPVNPTPTTFARFGLYGSPYASLDLTGVDPALVEFDQRTTGVEQFCELTEAAHHKGARVFLDLVINHTGWGSALYEQYPEWFKRQPDGRFHSPGAWGTTWEDLVELEQGAPELGKYLADCFLTWCRRGVDGFRCDAGYMVPLPIWRYITARVRREFPNTVFLLEGLGGAWEVTEALLTEGGMQWAYSELFQNYSGEQVAWYLDYALRQSQRKGVYVHYSETHDNPRLAANGRKWSLLRNRLCALTSVGGGFGFTCGVEWLADEKIVVHDRSALNWGMTPNIIAELARLHEVLRDHPCFFDGASLRRLSGKYDDVFALERVSQDGQDRVLVVVNTEVDQSATFRIDSATWASLGDSPCDLLHQTFPSAVSQEGDEVSLGLEPGAVYCVAAALEPSGVSGEAYRQRCAVRAWIVERLQRSWAPGLFAAADLERLIDRVVEEPLPFLALLKTLRQTSAKDGWPQLLGDRFPEAFPTWVLWEPGDERRIVPVPAGHWLVLQHTESFSVEMESGAGGPVVHDESVDLGASRHWIAVDTDRFARGTMRLRVRLGNPNRAPVWGQVLLLNEAPGCGNKGIARRNLAARINDVEAPTVLLTNGRGAMARLGIELGRVKSKYDCLLGANLHESVPVDRHVLAKRMRVWVNAGGLITALGMDNLLSFTPGPPATWRYLVCAGQGRWVPLDLTVDMVADRNSLVVSLRRAVASSLTKEEVARLYGADNAARAMDVPPAEIDSLDVTLTVRVDLEDRNFHCETERSAGSEAHFDQHTRPLENRRGFCFRPAADRGVHVECQSGRFHSEAEWSEGVGHPVEASRGQTRSGDAFSPGWFELNIPAGASECLQLSAEREQLSWDAVSEWFDRRRSLVLDRQERAETAEDDSFGAALVAAASDFVVRRNDGLSVIAGYPWFLDWGRDSLICARGLLTCGYEEAVVQLLQVYGRLESDGTLPNSIHGEDTSNRDTSDAPLWFGMVCGDLVNRRGLEFLSLPLGGETGEGRTVGDVLANIAVGYCQGTPNGIRMDSDSGLVWSPSHFTWMDTNYPAGTPREGYPVEIQVMWIELLQLLHRAGIQRDGLDWETMANRARESFHEYYWLEEAGYLADLVRAAPGESIASGTVDSALRSNFPLAVCTGLLKGERAKRAVAVALRHLIVPGGVRSLAALPVDVPLAVHGRDGQLLNDPENPYWGRYEGDEDTRRKPAYHNGTAWTWPLGMLLEALFVAHDRSAEARAAVRSYLSASEALLDRGCLGQLPEVMDGDAPHTQRGCDAQAWGVTEALRVWKLVS